MSASCLGVLTLSAAHARLAPDGGIGGTGGSPFRVDCGESGVLVGLAGRAGLVIDRVAGLCVKVDPHFGTMIGGVYETAGHGGAGGGTFRRLCPAREVLVGISGDARHFEGATVVRSLGIVCMPLGIRNTAIPPQIMGTQSTSRPNANPAAGDQDRVACQTYSRDAQREWSFVGRALEGSTGNYVDRLKVVCSPLRHDASALRIEMHSTPGNGIVSERAPVALRWRITSARPELMPGLQTHWVLLDHSHALKGAAGFAEPSTVANPCAHAQGPCNQSAATSVAFKGLPPAAYELRLTAEPSVMRVHADRAIALQERIRFEVRSSLATATPSERPSTQPLGGLATQRAGLAAKATGGVASAPVLEQRPRLAAPTPGLVLTPLQKQAPRSVFESPR